ncbi:MAG: response regulator [Helicobacteraceae bacterium]|nr:response regulator [Helicobacteraceae bacterium]
MTILVLDASLTVRSMIDELLCEMQFDNLNIELFENGNEALEFVQTNSVDLVFSAIETEGMDGITFVDLILRDNPKLVSKLFIVTSQNNTEHFEDMKDVGAKRFIKKPINSEYFRHFVIPEINKVLNRN